MASGLTLSPVPRGAYDPSYAGEGTTAGLRYPALPSSPLEQQPQGQGTPFGFDAQSGTVWVNGREFDKDDHQSALDSKSALDGPQQQMPSNFRPMQISEFGGYIQRIKDPSFPRLMSKNLGIGVDVSQMLGGSVLKFVGAEETGQAVIDQQLKDMGFKQPYQRTFTDDALESPEGAAEWFVANAAQMSPLMAEIIVAAGVGALVGGPALVGGAAAGTTAGATGLGAGLIGGISRWLLKGGINLATKAGRTETATAATRGLEILRSGGQLAKGSAEWKALRAVGGASGGKLGALSAAYGVGLGDVYQTVEESGNYDSPTLARIVSAFVAAPYAYAEVLPGQLAVTTAMKGFMGAGSKAGVLKRLGTGAAVGGALEGTTEVVQDMLALGAAGELDFHDPETRKHLINAFAAGAGVGVPIGGVANLIRRAPKGADTENLDLVGVPQLPAPPVPKLLPPPPKLLPPPPAEPEQLELFPDQDLGTAPVEPAEFREQGELFDVPDPNQFDLFDQPVAEEPQPVVVEEPQQFDLFDQPVVEEPQPEQFAEQLDLFDQSGVQLDLFDQPVVEEPQPGIVEEFQQFELFPDQSRPGFRTPRSGFSQEGVPTLFVPTRDAAGNVVTAPVPVEELLTKSTDEIKALEGLAICLRSKLGE